MTWDVAAESLYADKATPTTMAITGLLGALVILMMLGGPSALVDDPWLFGVAIAPGLRLAGPWLAGRTKDIEHRT